MDAFLFHCPRTGQTEQGYTTERSVERETLVSVTCHACGGIHFVSPKGEEAERDAAKDNNRFSSFVIDIVKNPLFQMSKNNNTTVQ